MVGNRSSEQNKKGFHVPNIMKCFSSEDKTILVKRNQRRIYSKNNCLYSLRKLIFIKEIACVENENIFICIYIKEIFIFFYARTPLKRIVKMQEQFIFDKRLSSLLELWKLHENHKGEKLSSGKCSLRSSKTCFLFRALLT